MFIDQEWKKAENNSEPLPPMVNGEVRSKKSTYYIFAGVLILIIISLISYYFFLRPDKNAEFVIVGDKINPMASSTKLSGGLPSELQNGNGDGSLYGTSTENLKAEDISFGYFYKKIKNDFKPNFNDYSLPINIKSDTINYYDASRKVDFDKYINELNNNGFVVLENKKSAEFDDFFSMYRFLVNKELPVAVTSDFIMYYYQNVFKKVYKDMEKNIFFEKVWDINNKLYTIALTKYKKRLVSAGSVNDPVLEAQRLETAYFAVALKILSPDIGQIETGTGANTTDKFSVEEADKYEFSVPEYLKDDVEKEVKIIREGKITAKSPVMRYSRDYSSFFVPGNYKNNAKLNNFYLALKWLNSVFPVYYKNADCPSCLLDYDDWMINLAAAGFLSKDFFENQDLKNSWAVIYKFISFFSGLRQDLTYLHYNEALSDQFSKDYSVENIFAQQNENREQDLAKLQEKLINFKFSELEGEINRTDAGLKPFIGMRMLQESYWPNDFIFSSLTGEELEDKVMTTGPSDAITACRSTNSGGVRYRCRGFGLDIVNLLSPVSDMNKYFYENTNYENYTNRIDDLRLQISKFDKYSWNNNIYWLNMDLSRLILSADRSSMPVYINNSGWQIEKNYNTVLGAWASLHLPEEKYTNFLEARGSLLGLTSVCSQYNFIEPNIELLKDLIARNEMLINMLTILKVSEKTNAVSIELKELGQKLEKMLEITNKELSGVTLDNDDCIFVKDLTTHYVIENGSPRNYTFNFDDKKLLVTSQGVKLLVIVNQFGDKKALVFGPVFNYSEK